MATRSLPEAPGLLTRLGRLFMPQPEDFQTRELELASTFDAAIDSIRRSQARARPWRPASVNEALGVPAILSAVSLISGVTGSLSMEAFKSGALVSDQTQIPRLLLRPNPRSTPGTFFRDTAFYRATRGEFWWWVAHRDTDGNADALFPVPPWEIIVEPNQRDRLNPTIRWLNRVMPNEDMIQDMYLPGEDGLRGVGPLQLAGAAVSVTVEAANWAANFFAGNLPSLIGTTDQDLDSNDLEALDKQWNEKAGNLPRWMTNGMKLEVPPFDAVKAQLTESRQFQVGETARMFLIPGPLLEYQMAGSSLTYRNEEDIWRDFQGRCLSPQYLEPIEQRFTDLMPRLWTGRFNLDQLLRADIKTRYDVYTAGITAGVFGPDYAQKKEGIIPGNVDFAPVPYSPPAADPGPIPMQTRELAPVRCSHCSALIGEAAGSYRLICRRCKTVNESLMQTREIPQSSALMFAEAMLTLATREQPTPTVTVHASPVTVEAAPAPNITFERGAFQVDAPPPAEVNVTTPDVRVEVAAPDMSEVAGAIAAIAERPQPDIHIDAPVTVEPANITVTVPGETSKRIERDEGGHIIRIVEETA